MQPPSVPLSCRLYLPPSLAVVIIFSIPHAGCPFAVTSRAPVSLPPPPPPCVVDCSACARLSLSTSPPKKPNEYACSTRVAVWLHLDLTGLQQPPSGLSCHCCIPPRFQVCSLVPRDRFTPPLAPGASIPPVYHPVLLLSAHSALVPPMPMERLPSWRRPACPAAMRLCPAR